MPGVVFQMMGIIGAILILMGFYRTSIGKWKNKSFVYELDNLVGASFLIVYQLHLKAYISVVVNVIWAIVAFRGLTPFIERYNRKARKKLKIQRRRR